MTYKNKWYETKLKDRRWQEKKSKVLERDSFKCQLNYSHKGTVMVHHKNYKKGKNPWEYPMKDLITLCETCHTKFHGKKETKANEIEKRLDEDQEKKRIERYNKLSPDEKKMTAKERFWHMINKKDKK